MGSVDSYEVWCDFDEDHSWTIIQKRLDGSVDFERDWIDYKNGFGHLETEYWLGRCTLNVITVIAL